MNESKYRMAKVTATPRMGGLAVSDPNELVDRVARYLPRNYVAVVVLNDVLIVGKDSLGWTLDDYVLPRLATGLIFAEEIT